MTNHITMVETNDPDALHAAEHLLGVDQARDTVRGQVDLSNVAGHDRTHTEQVLAIRRAWRRE